MIKHWQGSLDGCCGIYSIINSLQLIFEKINSNKCRRLFHECLIALEKKYRLSKIVSDGIYIYDLAYLFKEVIQKEYPIKRSKPFHKKRASIDEWWERTQDFLSKPNRAVIIGLAQ